MLGNEWMGSLTGVRVCGIREKSLLKYLNMWVKLFWVILLNNNLLNNN